MSDERIAKLIRLLSSSSDAEVIASARALLKALQADGKDIHDLAERASGKVAEEEMERIAAEAFRRGLASAAPGFQDVSVRPSHQEMAREILQSGRKLWEKEEKFVNQMVDWYRPTEKQSDWLLAIYNKYVKRRA
jgi:hypothetical protein